MRRGLTLQQGRARWDCAVWGRGAETARIEDIVGASGLLPPERACRLATLAGRCGPDLLEAVARAPQWAADLAEARACVVQRTRETGEPAAWDAAVALALEDEDIGAALRLADDAFAKELVADPECAARRVAARRLAAARRGRWRDVWLRGALDLLADRDARPGAHCVGLGPVGDELRRETGLLQWEAASIQRQQGEIAASCAMMRRMQETGALAAAPAADRNEAARWASACAQLSASTAAAP